MVLIILLEVSTDGGNSKCFRPLAGIMVLIRSGWHDIKFKVHACFRPLAGIMVLIDWLKYIPCRYEVY